MFLWFFSCSYWVNLCMHDAVLVYEDPKLNICSKISSFLVHALIQRVIVICKHQYGGLNIQFFTSTCAISVFLQSTVQQPTIYINISNKTRTGHPCPFYQTFLDSMNQKRNIFFLELSD